MSIATSDTLIPRPSGEAARLPGTPVFLEIGNENGAAASAVEVRRVANPATEVATGQRLAVDEVRCAVAGDVVEQRGAGYHETKNRGNHAQIVTTPDVAVEIQLLLGQLGVNLAEARVGRKHIFKDFLHGRLVSFLAMGLSLRQASA